MSAPIPLPLPLLLARPVVRPPAADPGLWEPAGEGRLGEQEGESWELPACAKQLGGVGFSFSQAWRWVPGVIPGNRVLALPFMDDTVGCALLGRV